MISFEQFVRPSLLKMQGHKKIFRQTAKSRLRSGNSEKRRAFKAFCSCFS